MHIGEYAVRSPSDKWGRDGAGLWGPASHATDVLDKKRGSWTGGVFYTGGYEIQFSPIKRGGRNFVQSAKVELTVNVSVE